MIGIPVSQIVIGTLFLNQCTIQRMIPIFLVVWGSFGVFKTLLSTGERVRNHVRKNEGEDDKEKNAKPNPLDGLISVFLFAWFIAGNYWIFSVYTTVNTVDSTSALYCHGTLYYFAFWMTIAMYILIGVAILIACCCCFVCCCCCGKKGSADIEK
ncbi:transmembrane protein 272-like [Branchiostoma floridae]|nr:transmembrane protein 272-like [Branchiostoma floridae]